MAKGKGQVDFKEQLGDMRAEERFRNYQRMCNSAVLRVSTENAMKAVMHDDATHLNRVRENVANTVDMTNVFPDVKERWEKVVLFEGTK